MAPTRIMPPTPMSGRPMGLMSQVAPTPMPGRPASLMPEQQDNPIAGLLSNLLASPGPQNAVSAQLFANAFGSGTDHVNPGTGLAEAFQNRQKGIILQDEANQAKKDQAKKDAQETKTRQMLSEVPQALQLYDAGDQNGALSVYARQKGLLPPDLGTANAGDVVYDKNTGKQIFTAPAKPSTGAGSDEKWGLQPQPYKMPDGSIKIGVLSDKGSFKEVPLPQGSSAVFPMQQLNTGTEFTPVDKFGRPGNGVTPIDNSGKSFDEGVGKNGSTSFQKYQDDANSAYSTLNQIDQMQQAMADPNFYSGTGANAVLGFKRAIVALGGDPNSVTSMETFNAASKKIILDGLGGSLGAQISNSDRDFIGATAANLQNTPQGNQAMLEIARKTAQRKIEVAQIAAQYVQQNGSLDANWPTFLQQYAEAHPLFGGGGAGGPAPAAGAPAPADDGFSVISVTP
jgi:hypothetical protein